MFSSAISTATRRMSAAAGAAAGSIYEIPVNDIYRKAIPFGDIAKGKVTLVVNVASQCGFTPQYEGLEEVYQKYKDRGLVIVGFPCNQFGAQEPGDEEQIKDFACSRFKASFPLMAKVDVNGDKTHPLYQKLKTAKPGLLGTTSVKWNFTKFLVDREGKVVERYSPSTTPAAIAKDIEKLL